MNFGYWTLINKSNLEEDDFGHKVKESGVFEKYSLYFLWIKSYGQGYMKSNGQSL